ncbi:MAG TPA: hypothetical protein VID29_00375 [Solirubrobacteraceae bacterium]
MAEGAVLAPGLGPPNTFAAAATPGVALSTSTIAAHRRARIGDVSMIEDRRMAG